MTTRQWRRAHKIAQRRRSEIQARIARLQEREARREMEECA